MEGDLLAMVLTFIGFLLVIVSLFLPKIIGKSVLEDTSPSAGARQHELRSLERVEDNLIKLEEVARETIGRIDTRARLLIRLIEESEVRRREVDQMVERLKEVRS